jgi:CRISPR-associated endonuclease/helicase Cas3
LLSSHRLDILLRPEEYATVDAIPRIQARPPAERRQNERLVDLEHARIVAGMLPAPAAVAAPFSRRRSATRSAEPGLDRDSAHVAWEHPQAALTGVLPQQQPFRADSQRFTTLTFLPNDDDENLIEHRVESDPGKRGHEIYVDARGQLYPVAIQSAAGIDCLGKFDLSQLLIEQAQALDKTPNQLAPTYCGVDVPESTQGWHWHPWLGFNPRR